MSKTTNQITVSKTPKLRFPEFSGDWSITTLDQLTTKIGDGIHSTPKYNDNGSHYFINGNNLVDGKISFSKSTKKVDENEAKKHNKELSNRTILLSINGTIGNLALYNNEKVMLGKSAAYINLKDNVDVKFIYNTLKISKTQNFFFSELTGTTIKNLSLKTIRKTKIAIPTKPEQTKIANFLSSLDNLINTQTQKLELLKTYKKGLMQQLFPQAGEKLPKLRFPEFSGDWQFTPLNKLAKRCIEKNRDGKILRVLTNSAEYGIVDQNDYFNKDIAVQGNLKGYFIVKKGDFVYNPRISAMAPVGPISKNNIAIGVVSPLYTVFRFKVNEDFYAHYFKSTGWHQYMRQVSSTGARHDRMAILKDDFNSMPLPITPTKDEQQKIANFLSSIDNLINTQTQKLELLKTYKKGLLQQMFV